MWKFTLKACVGGVPAGTEVEVAGFMPSQGNREDLVEHYNKDNGCTVFFVPVEKLNTCPEYNMFGSLAWYFRKSNGDCLKVYSNEMGPLFNDGITRVSIIRKAVKL